MKRVFLAVVASVIWFGALFRAAYDLWAASTVFLIVTFLVSLFAAVIYRKRVSLHLPFISSSILFLSAVWLSSVHAWDINTARLEAWEWTFAVILFYLLLNTMETDDDWNRLFYWSGSVMIPLTTICLWQQGMGHPDPWGHWEIAATLNNSMVLAGFTLNWIYFYWEESRRQQRSGMILFLICLIVLALTRSLWSFISLAIGFAVYYRTPIILWIQRHKRVAILIGTLLCIFLAAIIMMKVRVNFGPYKEASRYYYWYTAIRIWVEHPWAGIGLGGYATAYPYFKTPQFQSTRFPHSFPLQWLCETGILGMLGLLAMATGAWRHLKRNASRQAPLVAVLCFSLMSINLEYLLNKILLLIILASALRTDHMPRYRIKPLWAGVFSLSLWLLSPFWIKMFVGSQWYTTGLAYEMGGNIPKAQESYRTSISIDNANADAYAALARIYERSYRYTNSAADLSEYRHYIQQALYWKKDLRYTKSLIDMPQTTGAPRALVTP